MGIFYENKTVDVKWPEEYTIKFACLYLLKMWTSEAKDGNWMSD